jgi:hypothetical protein
MRPTQDADDAGDIAPLVEIKLRDLVSGVSVRP